VTATDSSESANSPTVRGRAEALAPIPARFAIDMRMIRSSGIGTYLRQVVPRLVGFSGSRFALLGDLNELRREGLGRDSRTTLHPCTAPIYSLREQLALRKSTPPDTELFWSPHYNIPLGGRAKLAVTVHDALHLARPEFVRGAHRRIYARAMFRELRRRATAIICDSRFTADELTKHAGITAGRVEVIHLGIDQSWFAEMSSVSPHPRPYFIYVGNVKPHKNLTGLLEAFSIAATNLPHDLLIVGRKEGFISGDSGAIERGARLGDRVRFTGEVADATLRAYVGHAEALILPSHYEGFGLPALEAMAAGCPALVSSAASLPEVCGDGALYFDPDSAGEIADRMRQITRDQVLRREMIAAGRERARLFTWESCARRTGEVLERAVAAG
jgi:glycosyltransferase involved in cell wall biosynthesis